MTISSKPQDNDALIEPQKNPLGENVLVGTQTLLRFFDDLVSLFNDDTVDLSEVLALIGSMESKSTAQAIELRRALKKLPHHQQQSLAPILRQIKDLESSLSQQINAVLALAKAVQARQAATGRTVNNVEHLCLSNLVRQRG